MQKSIIPIIEAKYQAFTDTEKIIADFFIKNEDYDMDFSAENIAKMVHVSLAALTRFAKKMGFNGFRQFIYEYKSSFKKGENISREITKRVLFNYEELLNKTYTLVDENTLNKITSLLISAKRVYIYGKGSSGLVANEMKLRFMRLGLFVEAITDDDIMKFNSVLVDKYTLVIAISVSGKKEVVTNSLRQAKIRGANTVFITANDDKSFDDFVDVKLLIAVKENLNWGNIISPQFPLLVMIDIFYAYFLNSDKLNKESIFKDSLKLLDEKEDI
ncbi:MAG: MurR/RpiR family transcriptional regulator [Tissierellia bacterium]|nr:MurR/RpiR family transcriptional regulator [Tissierellia bacterium]